MMTQCCISHLYNAKDDAAIALAKTFERRKCNHRILIEASECIKSVIGPENKHRYVVATQTAETREYLRAIPAVPLIYINRSVMILEPPSGATLIKQKQMERAKIAPSKSEMSFLASKNSDIMAKKKAKEALKNGETPIKKKRKGPKGPNSLSVKKRSIPTPAASKSGTLKRKKQETSNENVDDGPAAEGEDGGKKRKRRRKKKVSEGVQEV